MGNTIFFSVKDRSGNDVFINLDKVVFIEYGTLEGNPCSIIHFMDNYLVSLETPDVIVRRLNSIDV